MASSTTYPPRGEADPQSVHSAREHQAAATTAGILFLVATVAGILSKVLTAPLAMQEMVLAVWMIARGFRPAAVPNAPAGLSAQSQPATRRLP